MVQIEEDARYKRMHQALCYVWFAGAWNQGTWMGIGNALMSAAYPDTASERTKRRRLNRWGEPSVSTIESSR